MKKLLISVNLSSFCSSILNSRPNLSKSASTCRASFPCIPSVCSQIKSTAAKTSWRRKYTEYKFYACYSTYIYRKVQSICCVKMILNRGWDHGLSRLKLANFGLNRYGLCTMASDSMSPVCTVPTREWRKCTEWDRVLGVTSMACHGFDCRSDSPR